MLAVAAAILVQQSRKHLEEAEALVPGTISINREQLRIRSGQFYSPDSTTPFTGWMLDHYPGGELSLRSAVINGRLHGLSEGWFTNGVRQLREAFHSGIPEGPRTTWHPNGRKRSEGTLRAGLQQGTYRQWDEQGQQIVAAEFLDGKAHGISLAWHASGFLKAEALMNHGEIEVRRAYPDQTQQHPTLPGEPKKSANFTSNQR